MDFYHINEEYNRYLQSYEKENRGVTKVPNIRYADRNKFAFGAVMQVNGMRIIMYLYPLLIRSRKLTF